MSLLTEIHAFHTEHELCGELDGGLDGPFVWFDCSCSARIVRQVDDEDSRGMKPARRVPLVVLLLLSAMLLFAGCTLPVHLGPLPDAGDDAATLVIIRPARFVAGGTQAVVAIDDVPVTTLGNDEHVALRVAPGARIVGIGYNSPLFGRPTSSDDYFATTVDAVARTTQYFRLEPNAGVATLNPMTPAAAQALLSTTRRVTGRPGSE